MNWLNTIAILLIAFLAVFLESSVRALRNVLGAQIDLLPGLASDPSGGEFMARGVAERLALALQASLVLRHSPPEVADAFLAGRVSPAGGRTFGTLPPGTDCMAIIERHRPRLSG